MATGSLVIPVEVVPTMTALYKVCKTDCYRGSQRARSLGTCRADGLPHRAMACQRAQQAEIEGVGWANKSDHEKREWRFEQARQVFSDQAAGVFPSFFVGGRCYSTLTLRLWQWRHCQIQEWEPAPKGKRALFFGMFSGTHRYVAIEMKEWTGG